MGGALWEVGHSRSDRNGGDAGIASTGSDCRQGAGDSPAWAGTSPAQLSAREGVFRPGALLDRRGLPPSSVLSTRRTTAGAGFTPRAGGTLWGCPAAQAGQIAPINRLASPLATGCHQLTPHSNAGTLLAGRGVFTRATVHPACARQPAATATRRWPVSVGSRRRRRLLTRSLAPTSLLGLAGDSCALICAVPACLKPAKHCPHDLCCVRRSHILQARRRGPAHTSRQPWHPLPPRTF